MAGGVRSPRRDYTPRDDEEMDKHNDGWRLFIDENVFTAGFFNSFDGTSWS